MFNLFVIEGCFYCHRAIDLAKKHKLTYKLHSVAPEEKEKYKKLHGMSTFPQILYGTKHLIGGSSDFENLINSLSYLKNNFNTTAINGMLKNIKL